MVGKQTYTKEANHFINQKATVSGKLPIRVPLIRLIFKSHF